MTKPTQNEGKVMSRYFIDWLIHDVMNGVDYTDVLAIPEDKNGNPIKDIILHKGKELNKDEVRQIYAEARYIKESRLWHFLLNDWHSNAIDLLRKSKNEDDMYVAKVLTYMISQAQMTLDKFIHDES